MLSIAIFSECYHPMRNGVVVSVTSFARELMAMGHRVTIFTVHHPDQANDEEGVYRFPSITLPMRARYPIAIPMAPVDARKCLDEQHFDIIHSNSLMLMGHVALFYHHRRNVPLVFTYHTLIEEYAHYIPLPEPMVRWRAICISRDYSNSVNHVITPAAHVAERLRRYEVNTPISVIPTGIDIEFLDSVPPGNIRDIYNIPAGVPLLVYAGRMAKEKNLSRLLNAFHLVLQREPDAHLLFIGGGPLEDDLRLMIDDLCIAHRTRLTGFVDREHLIQGVREADLFVFASKTETQGLVIGEAMACGVPVVAVAAEAPGEIISPGCEGLLTADEDEPFAEAILTLLHDAPLRAQMSRQARIHAESLSAQRCTERLVAVYQQVITEKMQETRLKHAT